MRSEYWRILSSVCILLALHGCATPPSGPSSAAFGPPSDSVDPSFTLGFGNLTAMFSPQSGNEDIEDWLLLGVKVAHDDENEVWFVRLSQLADDDVAGAPPENAELSSREFSIPFGLGAVKTGSKFNAPAARILIETFDREGAALRSSIRSVPRQWPGASLLDLWTELSSPAGSLFGEQGVGANNIAGMMMTLQTLGGSRALRPIRDAVREQVVKQPKILGLLLNGFRICVEADFSQSELVRSLRTVDGPASPRYQIDFPLLLTGQRLFDCRVVVGPPAKPYNLLGGTLLFEAAHPDKPQNRLTVRVLAAQHKEPNQNQTLAKR